MIRAALYARYSSEKQNERSIADQVDTLVRHAGARGWAVVATYSDAAISGAAMANRPGLLQALAEAEAGAFDVLLTEHEDRIARNLEHLAHVVNRLEYADAYLATLATEKVEGMHVAMQGFLGAEYLKNLGQKTRRGMRANAERGLATGSRLFGYQSAPGGLLAIVPAEANAVRRIFAEYLDGYSPREIAARLNREGVAGPRGGMWSASTISGSRQRANGILHTELYAGVKVWNRMDVRKDPRTGKRTPRMRPESEWRRTAVPELAIVDQETWARAQALKAEAGASSPRQRVARRPWPFSGLIRCGVCGGGYTIYSTGKLACANRLAKGEAACTNRRTPMRATVERRVIEAIRTKLLTPEAVRTVIRDYHEVAEARRRAATAQREPLERRLAEVRRSIERIVDAVEQGSASPAMLERMKAREAERIALEEQLAQVEAKPFVVRLLPNAPALFADLVDRLHVRLAAAAGAGAAGNGPTEAERELVEALRELVVKIVVTPESADVRAPLRIELVGRLAGYLELEPSGPLDSDRMVRLVAGGRIELPTCGL